MSDDLSPIAHALGRIPTGLYLVATNSPTGPIGFVGSLLVQVGFEPPTVCVAVAKERSHLAAMRFSGCFAVSILDAGSSGIMGAFFKSYPEGKSPFDDLEVRAAPSGSPIVATALAWFECSLSGEHETGDHMVVFGEVTAGELLHEGDPSVHLRKNGLEY